MLFTMSLTPYTFFYATSIPSPDWRGKKKGDGTPDRADSNLSVPTFLLETSLYQLKPYSPQHWKFSAQMGPQQSLIRGFNPSSNLNANGSPHLLPGKEQKSLVYEIPPRIRPLSSYYVSNWSSLFPSAGASAWNPCPLDYMNPVLVGHLDGMPLLLHIISIPVHLGEALLN